jgi:hypothetical protein
VCPSLDKRIIKIQNPTTKKNTKKQNQKKKQKQKKPIINPQKPKK